ncbi:MAG: putative alpha/beta-hydrolase family hydrolase [Ilumatobacter sp.]|jgi:predicted alpha/beta-hydrolase family hydrolase
MAAPSLFLYPGAGSDRNHPRLLAIEDRVAARTSRLDFPYRKQGRKGPPDRAPKLMASVRDDLTAIVRRRSPLIMGGHSMGGRMASMVAADVDGVGPVKNLAALVLFGYPLHPPKKPDKLRVEHFPGIAVPCLFISGTKDEFGTPEELEHWTSTIAAPVEHIWLDGARHDLKGRDALIADAVAEFVQRIA